MRAASADLSVEARERYDFVRALLLRLVPPPADLVELGAAPGDQSVALARAGYRVTAVDLGDSSDAWAEAEEGRMVRELGRAGARLVLWNLERAPYPFADESFDTVVMTEVFEHLRDYPAQSLVEARRILRPGGVLVLTTPNAAYLRNRLRLVLGHTVHTPLPDWIHGLPSARHAREYTFGEMRELARLAGLEIELLAGRHFNLSSGRRGLGCRAAKRAIDLVAQVRPQLGPHIVLVARRREG